MTARRLVSRLQRRPKPGWRAALLDECRARLFPTRAPQWAKRGHYPEIPLYDRHGKCAVFGAVDLHTGRMFHHLARSLSDAEQLQLLDQIVVAYPGERVLLVWDNGPTHRNRRVQEWLAQHRQVVCFWLPPYSGADVHPIEHCWRWFRDHVTHNRLFENLEFENLEQLMEATRELFFEVASYRPAVLARLGQM